ncbi:MAG: 30S ribosomal protein S18 [Planctomycetota bacterium]
MAKRRRTKRYSRENKCRFCRDKAATVDYKNVAALQKLTTTQGKLFSRKRSGNCAKHQRLAKQAIKRARIVALMPFVAS